MTVSHDDEDDDNIDDDSEFILNASFLKNNGQKEQNITREVKDKNLVYLMRTVKQKTNLLNWADKFHLEISMTKDTIRLYGPATAVEARAKEMSEIIYKKSKGLGYDTARCIKDTYYIKNKLKDLDLELRIVPSESKDICTITIYGGNQKFVDMMVDMVNQSIDKVILLLVMPGQHEYGNEVDLIFDYLRATYDRKCKQVLRENKIEYQFGKIKNQRFNRYLFYLFAKCEDNRFEKIKSYFAKEFFSLCFLNITPRKGGDLKVNPTGICEEKVNILTVSDKSYLILGKSKYLKKEIKDLMKSEDTTQNVYKYRIRFKTPYKLDNGKEIGIESFSEKIGLAADCYPGHHLYTFMIDANLPKPGSTVIKILTRHDEIMKENLYGDLFSSRLSDTVSFGFNDAKEAFSEETSSISSNRFGSKMTSMNSTNMLAFSVLDETKTLANQILEPKREQKQTEEIIVLEPKREQKQAEEIVVQSRKDAVEPKALLESPQKANIENVEKALNNSVLKPLYLMLNIFLRVILKT